MDKDAQTFKNNLYIECKEMIILNTDNLPHSSGIYMVINKINYMKYIGQAKDIYKRFKSHHLSDYKNPKNSSYNTKFYQALRKYGIDNFDIIILTLCPENKLDELEIEYIAKFDTYKHGYNSTLGGQNWSNNIHSKETELKRQKTREQNQSLKSENHPRAKMTNQEVINVRQRYINGETIDQIYKDYKDRYSSKDTFKRIVLGETYKNVGNIPSKSQIRHTNAKLTDQQVREIRKRYETEKISYAKLGEEYGISSSSVYQIIKRKTYQHIK